MEVSDQDCDFGNEKDCPLQGQELIEKVALLTELPDHWIEEEIHDLLDQTGYDRETVTLEELRSSLLTYLESLQDQFLPENEVLEQKN